MVVCVFFLLSTTAYILGDKWVYVHVDLLVVLGVGHWP